MKTTVKYLTLLSVMMIFSLSLSGQKNLVLKDMNHPVAYASDLKPDIELNTDQSLNAYRFFAEDKVELEEWMVQPFSQEWNILNEIIKVDEEEPLKLCDWMICCTDWKMVQM